MVIRKFPKIQSGKVLFRFRDHLMTAFVEVRRVYVIVTLYNGYSMMFVNFRFRKCDLLKEPSFLRDLYELQDLDLISLGDPVLRLLCRLALSHLSSRSLDILSDSYKSASEFFRC